MPKKQTGYSLFFHETPTLVASRAFHRLLLREGPKENKTEEHTLKIVTKINKKVTVATSLAIKRAPTLFIETHRIISLEADIPRKGGKVPKWSILPKSTNTLLRLVKNRCKLLRSRLRKVSIFGNFSSALKPQTTSIK